MTKHPWRKWAELSEAERNEIRQAYHNDVPLVKIQQMHNVYRKTIKCNCDPAYRAMVLERNRRQRLLPRPKPARVVVEVTGHRSITARLLGDPLPGRSALDHRREGVL